MQHASGVRKSPNLVRRRSNSFTQLPVNDPLLDKPPPIRSPPRRLRPTWTTLVWLAVLAATALYYQRQLDEARRQLAGLRSTSRPDQNDDVRPGREVGTRDARLASILNETVPDLATTSCEVCILNPSNPLCEYGLDNIRMSRAYEGSGARLRRVLKRALKGEEIGVGVIGASVTAGHSVPPGYQRWQERFFDDFKKMFPNAKLHVGAMGATDSRVRSGSSPAVRRVLTVLLLVLLLLLWIAASRQPRYLPSRARCQRRAVRRVHLPNGPERWR